jgi:hypothetical protein
MMNIPGIPDGTDLPDIELPDINPAVLFNALKTNLPLLMLPARLETRFYKNPDRLRIRIYPDQIHINSHQTALGPHEAELGRRFWELAWHSWDKALDVFASLSEKLGVWRAAWVMEATAPTNMKELGKGKPIFPKPEIGRDPSAPARLALLPQRWFAVGILRGETVFVEHGAPVDQTLRFAPMQLESDEDLDRWLVDFDAALRKGMALEIALTGSKQAVADEGLDELIVVGARVDNAAAAFEDTLRGHYYTRGFDFVPQGTPTNNTETVRSPWQWNTADVAAVFARRWQPTAAIAGSYRDRFAKALGLNASGIVARAVHGDVAEIPAMEAMNHALWYITWGEYLRFVLHDGERAPLSDGQIDWLRDWFTGHVRGGAVYPAFQIGSMPYGVLPVQLQPVPGKTQTNDEYVQTVLASLRAGWERSLPNVPHLDPTATASATDAPATTDLEAANDSLISILSSHPHPASFFTRYLYNLRNPVYDLDILVGMGIIIDPVDQQEALLLALIEHMIVVDGVWAFATNIEMRGPFDSLADQRAYFEGLLAGLDARIEDLQDQINGLSQIRPLPLETREEINALTAKRDLVDIDIRGVITQIIGVLGRHAARVSPVNDLGLPPLMDVVSGDGPNAEHFYYLYKDEMTEWGSLTLVQAEDATGGATAAVYLDWLHDYALGTVSGTGPDGLPNPAPLLFQLVKRAVDRTNAWGNDVLLDLDDFLSSMDRISKNASAAARVNQTQRLTTNSRRLTGIADLLDASLKAPAKDSTRQAVSSVPRTVFKTASAQLAEYKRVTGQTSAELDRTIGLLDDWSKVKATGTSPANYGGTVFVPIGLGGRARELADAIGVLVNLLPDELELRMKETLGLAMHRLDAWITAYAEQRVDALRAKAPTGLQIGGFGWVENLRPDTAGTTASQGYIHAPSMTHAAAAAVLRSGYSAYSDGTATAPLAVDLRSNRVRVAQWMMDGMRQGQRINDLLGYRFERFVHDNNLDVWIDPVRDAVANSGTTELSGSRDTVVVDGLALLELWDGGAGPLESLVVIPEGQDFANIQPALEHLVWIVDSMADLILAESVHALVQGDYERASAIQNAAAFGDVPPSELRSVLTPNSGMTITHRILLIPQGEGSAWQHNGLSIRSQLEPGLEAWAASIVGSPDSVVYGVRGGPDDPVETLTLGALPLSALDAVYLAPVGETITGSALAALIASTYRQRHETADRLIPDVTIEADVPVGEGQITLAEFVLLANTIRQVLGGARSATANDFALGAGAAADSAVVNNLMERMQILVGDFDKAIAAFDRAGVKLLPALLRLSFFNLPEAVPASTDAQALTTQSESAVATAKARRKAIRRKILRLNAPDVTDDQRLRLLREIVGILVGRDFPAMLRFSMPLPQTQIRDESQAVSDSLRPVIGWLLKMARVRPELVVLREMMTAAEALRDQPLFPFWVAQVPFVEGEAWAGAARPNEDGKDRLSLVLTTNGDSTAFSGETGGLVLDQWIERIPSDYEMTGLTFHFDAPTSRPPQALLLAVPPVGSDWNFDLVVDTVREAFALARLRAVAPETLGEYGHHLPAVYLSSDLDTIGAADGV